MTAGPSPETLGASPIHRDASTFLRLAALAVLGTALLTLSAKLRVPFYPVPMTMQTIVVLALGAAYGPRLAVATVGLYMAQGAMGLPVFADSPERGIGLAYMAGPTGGYLLGFLAAAGLVGFFVERGLASSVRSALAVMALGHAVIFACGLAWLSALIGFEAAWAAGVLPFLPSTVVKTLLAAVLTPFLLSFAARRSS